MISDTLFEQLAHNAHGMLDSVRALGLPESSAKVPVIATDLLSVLDALNDAEARADVAETNLAALSAPGRVVCGNHVAGLPLALTRADI